MEGSEDFVNSIYPEIDANILAGQVHYKIPSTTTFRAPVAKMFSPQLAPVPRIDNNIRLISRNWYPPFESTAIHDDYSEVYALSPKDRPQMFAGNHYSDRHALSPVENTGKGEFEELALLPFQEEYRKPVRRGRKPKSEAKITKTAESNTVIVPETRQQKVSRSPKPRRQVKVKKHGDCPVEDVWEKTARGRKRKHPVEQKEEGIADPVRRSKRIRMVVSYAE